MRRAVGRGLLPGFYSGGKVLEWELWAQSPGQKGGPALCGFFCRPGPDGARPQYGHRGAQLGSLPLAAFSILGDTWLTCRTGSR